MYLNLISWKHVQRRAERRGVVHTYEADVPGKGCYLLFLTLPNKKRVSSTQYRPKSIVDLIHRSGAPRRVAASIRVKATKLRQVKKYAFPWAERQIFGDMEILAKACDNPDSSVLYAFYPAQSPRW